jgi:hypothetical protein
MAKAEAAFQNIEALKRTKGRDLHRENKQDAGKQ